jgi:hypothetical protein
MKPEEKSRREIDRQLQECGRIVQDHSQMNISAGPVGRGTNRKTRLLRLVDHSR